MNVLGIGIDLVDIARIEKMVKRKGQRVIKKLLTERERAYVATLQEGSTGRWQPSHEREKPAAA